MRTEKEWRSTRRSHLPLRCNFQLAMWATYKSEIMERERDEKDFLKNFYERNRAQHEGDDDEGGKKAGAAPDGNENETEAKQGRQQMNEALSGGGDGDERRNSGEKDEDGVL